MEMRLGNLVINPALMHKLPELPPHIEPGPFNAQPCFYERNYELQCQLKSGLNCEQW